MHSPKPLGTSSEARVVIREALERAALTDQLSYILPNYDGNKTSGFFSREKFGRPHGTALTVADEVAHRHVLSCLLAPAVGTFL